MTSGIYSIKNKTNGKCYYGSTLDLTKRKNDHFNLLKCDRHFNRLLQLAVKQDGINNFEFNIICELEDVSKILEHEQTYLDMFWDGGINCYNISRTAYRTINLEYIPGPLTEEHKAKISKTMKGRKRTKQERENISKGKTGKRRKPFSEETRQKMRLAQQKRRCAK